MIYVNGDDHLRFKYSHMFFGGGMWVWIGNGNRMMDNDYEHQMLVLNIIR